MNILWYSNAPWAPTGYGNQTGLVVPHLVKKHNVSILANYGLNGQPLGLGGVTVYPAGKEGYSNDVVEGTCKEVEADVLITLYDAWPLKFWRSESFETPWLAWAPIDHETITPGVKESLSRADLPIAYSVHGVLAMQEAGLKPAYVPHGIDTKLYSPQPIKKSDIGLDDDVFVFGFVGTNMGFPSRKSIPEILLAYQLFRDAHPDIDSVLYMHTLTSQERQGLNIRAITDSLGITDSVLVADQWNYNKGYPQEYLARMYSAFDCLLSPSQGEGFGIPIVEAMACGTPVIGANNTSMVELIGHEGDRGLLTECSPFWTQQGAWASIVDPIDLSINMSLVAETILDQGKDAYRGSCRGFAVDNYDFETVVGPMWDSLLEAKQWEK